MFAEPAGEIVGVVEAGLGGGGSDGGAFAQRGLRGLQALLIAQAAKGEAVFAFEATAEGVTHVAGFAGDFLKRFRGAQAFAHAGDEGGGRERERLVVGLGRLEQAGDDGEHGRIIGEREAAFGRHSGEQGVQFVERLLRQVAVEHARAWAALVFEHEAERATVARHGKPVVHAGRDDEQVARARFDAFFAQHLHALAGEIEDELVIGVRMRGDLGLAMAVELKFSQHEA